MKRIVWMSLCVVLATASVCFGRGVMIPTDKSLPPLAILSHRVSATIDSQLAVTKVEQVFQNNTDRVLEATYVFPLPPGATISDFAMYVNGQRQSGELVEKDKARAVYAEIVRRLRDPGLLECMGGNLFKLNVFPIAARAKQKIEIQYAEVLARDSGMHRYVYPLKTDEPASRTMQDFTVSITLRAREPITNIYSPTHPLGISRKSDFEAVAGFEKDASLLDRDVVLYYTVSDRSFGTSVLSHKPVAGQDGYFMLLVTPKTQVDEKDILPRDVCFVLDTSGSMLSDNKLRKAKDALKFCVSSLRDKDRFNVIAFSTSTNALAKTLLQADASGKALAAEFIDRQEAVGGTALYAALAEAVSMAPEGAGRPYTVVFLTDGRPTVGEDREEEIVRAAQARGANVRVFTWGVGADVNTRLLDLIAQKTRAVGEYVSGDEDIELKVSLFFNKMSKPVLTAAAIDWGRMKVRDVYPRELGDLFAGQQVTVFGRYEGAGDAAMTLVGTVNGQKVSQVFEATFGKEPGNVFVEKLWAARHVGFLLDEVRLRGEKPEIKEEIIRLSRTYGIQTPYTSYLVLETKEDYARHGLPTPQASGLPPNVPSDAPRRLSYNELRTELDKAGPAAPSEAPAGESLPNRYKSEGGDALGDRAQKKEGELREITGEAAVRLAKTIGGLRRNDAEGMADRKGTSLVRRVGERSFYWYAGFYVDGNFTDKLPTVRVKYLSDAYFALLDKIPALRDIFALGDRIIVVVNGTALIVDDAGKEQLTDAELAPLGVK